VLLVFGGSQGAAALNEAALGAFADGGPSVLHLCGERYLPGLRGRVSRPDYRLLGWTDDFGAALDASNLVLARAGGSVWEVAATGKPAVLVPSPNVTADHQTKNARYFERAGGAIVVSELEIARVPQVVLGLLSDAGRLSEMGEAMRRAARPDAADEIAEELIALASS
jgi:UDP-N-acetylglucosamine--N-acetylmuramyl-(pentapeptide) pyrophosphoryl-undecaprenol N-acetylglucosamine transferase